MKIERISENQIKCTLTRSDLASHQIKLSELAYGTEKTRGLFQDMMDQAFDQFGFETSDHPLMIEAIPVSMDCIVLMITKVDNPDEMDTNFANFSSLTDLLSPGNNRPAENTAPAAAPAAPLKNRLSDSCERIYSFENLDTVIDFARKTGKGYKGESALYRSPDDRRYYLLLNNKDISLNEFGRVCTSALEYGSKEPAGFARSAYISEHFDCVIKANALPELAEI